MSKNYNIRKPIIISLGAIAGVSCRYYFGVFFSQNFISTFPIDIFFINISGCFLMGLLSTILAKKYNGYPELFLLLITGFLGTYTTFSTYELNTVENIQNLSRDIFYWLGSPIFGLISLELGIKIADFIISYKQ